jgi:hypothetical protein
VWIRPGDSVDVLASRIREWYEVGVGAAAIDGREEMKRAVAASVQALP